MPVGAVVIVVVVVVRGVWGVMGVVAVGGDGGEKNKRRRVVRVRWCTSTLPESGANLSRRKKRKKVFIVEGNKQQTVHGAYLPTNLVASGPW